MLAIAAGTVAGTAFPLVILAIAILGSSGSDGDVRAMIGIVIATVLIPLSLVASSALLLGVPATIALKRVRAESESSYTLVGAVFGFLVPGVILAVAEQNSGVFFSALPASVLGAFSGGVTGRSWWRFYREAAADAES